MPPQRRLILQVSPAAGIKIATSPLTCPLESCNFDFRDRSKISRHEPEKTCVRRRRCCLSSRFTCRGRNVREPGVTVAAEHHGDDGPDDRAGSVYAAGPRRPGGRRGPFATLPAFCRVALTLKPTPQSDIKAEVWLPSAGWNGKLQVVGNGALGGFDQLCGDGDRSCRRLCRGVHRHGAHGRRRKRHGTPGSAYRLRASRDS